MIANRNNKLYALKSLLYWMYCSGEDFMLVLTRKEDESLIIDGNIKLTILSIKGGQVRVGIEAPKEVSVHREELLVGNQPSVEVSLTTNTESKRI